ncbi:MAG: hypothetical protein P9L97_08925 [Candidatus Tenebribacter davisii]|nr:hypothetical protein [Candidatus Tenebribacter davisii]
MSIEKASYLKHKGNVEPYTRVWNKTIEAIPNDSALGIYLYLASKPEDWIVQEQDIMKRFKRGRDYVRKCLNILKEAKLYNKRSVRDEKGHITHWETELYSQVPENPSCGEHQVPENPTSGKTHLLVNPTHTKERNIQIKEKDTNAPIVQVKNNKNLTPRQKGTNPRAMGTNPRATGTNPKNKNHHPKGESGLFIKFWHIYPKKKARKVCLDLWNKKNMDEIAKEVIEKLVRQVNYDDSWLRGYAPDPKTYLNQERWADDIQSSVKSNSSSNWTFDSVGNA